MRVFVCGFIASLLLLVQADKAAAQTYEDSRGLYGGMTISLGWNSWSSAFGGESDTMTGFSFMAGYRFSPWFGGDVDFMWVGGGEAASPPSHQGQSASLLTVGLAAKVYPLVRLSTRIPEWTQPYLVVGVGSGIAELADRGSDKFGSANQSAFLARFGAGVEIMMTQHWGAVLDGSYYVATSGALEGIGVFRLGFVFHY